VITVIFACVHSAGRSQMAAAFFNRLADPARAHGLSAGTSPGYRVHPEVVAAMAEAGFDLRGAMPRRLTDDLARNASWLITMGCGEHCPMVPGARVEDWPLPDPKDRPFDEVRGIRDEIARRVEALVTREGWRRSPDP
jgi:arsenate reductase (thioredoxin)